MLRILPLASRLGSPEQVNESLNLVHRRIEELAIPHEMGEVAYDLPLPVAADRSCAAVFLLTGGTEHLALAALQEVAGPAIVLAHPDQNSFPAALELLARLRQLGRSGRIILLGDHPEGYDSLSRVAGCVAARDWLHAARLGRIGAPSDWLVGSQPDAAIVRDVWGPRIVDVAIDELRQARGSLDATAVTKVRDEVGAGARLIEEPGVDDIERAASVALALRAVVDSHRLDACTVRCFDIVMKDGTTGCLGLSMLLDDNVVAGCEGDVPATLTMLWIQAVTGQVSFMANPQALDAESGVLWLAHCTIARRLVRRYALRSHFESSIGVAIQGDLEPGPVTVARIGGADLREVFVSNGRLEVSEEQPRRCRTQVRVRLESGVRSLLTAPLGNHHVLVRGHWAERLREYHELFVRHAASA